MKTTFVHQLSTSEIDIKLQSIFNITQDNPPDLRMTTTRLPQLPHCELALQHLGEHGVLVSTADALDAVQEDSLQGDVGLLKRTRKAPSAPPNSTYTDPSSSSLELEHHAPTPSGL